MGRRFSLCFYAISTWLGLWFGAQDLCASETTEPLDRQQFQAELERLATICDRFGLANEANLSRTWLAPQRPDHHRLYLPSELPKPSGSKEIDGWRSYFVRGRKRYAEHLFARAKALAASDEAAAYRLLWQVLRENPEHGEAKRILGTQLVGLSLRPQQKTGIKVPELSPPGMLPRWQSANFQLYTRASAKNSLLLISQLEQLYVLWTQMFYELWAPPGVLARRFQGSTSAWPDAQRMEVMLLANRHEYVQLLGVSEENIGKSVGYYNPIRKLSIFYQAEELTETLNHELTHQFFSEVSSLKMAPILDKVEGAWSIEGVALYMESLSPGSEGWTVGGLEARRLQTARYRALRDEHWESWEPYCKGTLQDWKSSPDIALLYSHAAGLTHLFLDNFIPQVDSKATFFSYLQTVYQGTQHPEELFRLLGDSEQAAQTAYRQSMVIQQQQLQALVPSAHSIEQLVLCRSELTDWTQLAEFKKLQWLDVSFTNLTNQNTGWLASLSGLQRLSIEGTQLDGSVMPQIAKLEMLTELDLSQCAIDDAGLAQLANHRNIQTLYLTGTKVTDHSLDVLSTLPKLESCEVSNTKITKEAWEAFQVKHLRPSAAGQ